MKFRRANVVFITFILLLFAFLVDAEGVFPKDMQKFELNQLIYPKNLVVGKDLILISDYPHIYLYRREPFALLKRIGRKGEGPGEFYVDQEGMETKMPGMICGFDKNRIYVNSRQRLTFFTMDGELESTKKLNTLRGMPKGFRKISDDFISVKTISVGGKLFESLIIFSPELKEKLEIARAPFWMRDVKHFLDTKYNFFERANGTLSFETDTNRIYVLQNSISESRIDIYDTAGKKRKTIAYKSDLVKIPTEFSRRVFEYYRYKFKRGLSANIKATGFPEYFPAVRKFFVRDGKIYLITYKEAQGKMLIVVLSCEGDLLKKSYVPIANANPEHLYPCDIREGKFFQVVENEEAESWELKIFEFN